MSKAVFKLYLWSLRGTASAALIVIAGLFIAVWSILHELEDVKQQGEEAGQRQDRLETNAIG